MKESAKNFSSFLRNMFIYQNQLFENLEDQQVIGYIPGLITGRYLSLILRTTQYWLFPPERKNLQPFTVTKKKKH
jgi:hypothetical protein